MKHSVIVLPMSLMPMFYVTVPFWPNIKILLQIYSTLSVTTATGERSSSTLKQTKSYLRSVMSENRLNELTMMYVHSLINIDFEQVIDKFSKRKNRKLEFLV